MLQINILYVGNIKDNFFAQAVAEYEKRLSAYCKIQNIELKEQCKDELIELISNKDSLPCFLNFNVEKEQLNYDIQRYEFYIEELVAELKHCLYELSIL